MAGNLEAAISFSPPLPADLPAGSVKRLDSGTTSAECAGPGQAAAGVLCVYERARLANPNVIANPITGAVGASRFGAVASYTTNQNNSFVDGIWSVTAP